MIPGSYQVCLAFYVRPGNLNVDSHPCAINTLSTELSLQPTIWDFVARVTKTESFLFSEPGSRYFKIYYLIQPHNHPMKITFKKNLILLVRKPGSSKLPDMTVKPET